MSKRLDTVTGANIRRVIAEHLEDAPPNTTEPSDLQIASDLYNYGGPHRYNLIPERLVSKITLLRKS